MASLRHLSMALDIISPVVSDRPELGRRNPACSTIKD
jgi:hypothetical protein